jgi:hypothetical protein
MLDRAAHAPYPLTIAPCLKHPPFVALLAFARFQNYLKLKTLFAYHHLTALEALHYKQQTRAGWQGHWHIV